MKQNRKNNVAITIITTVITILVITLGWFYVLPKLMPQRFGVSITDLVSTDQLKDFVALYNTSINALNDGKIDAASSTLESLTSAPNLATIGTITTGTWTATDVGVAHGGTGASSFTDNTLFFGNGINAFTEVATGTAGQLLTLTSGQPAWSSASFDQAADYVLSGSWNFTGTQYLTSFNASSTLVIGGTSRVFDFSNTATGTVLKTDGSTNVAFGFPDWELIVSTTTDIAMNNATTTIPSGFTDIRMIVVSQGVTGAQKLWLKINDDSELPTNYHTRVEENSVSKPANFDDNNGMTLYNTSTTSPSFFDITILNVVGNATVATWIGNIGLITSIPDTLNGSGVWETTEEITTLGISAAANNTINSGMIITVYGRR